MSYNFSSKSTQTEAKWNATPNTFILDSRLPEVVLVHCARALALIWTGFVSSRNLVPRAFPFWIGSAIQKGKALGTRLQFPLYLLSHKLSFRSLIPFPSCLWTFLVQWRFRTSILVPGHQVWTGHTSPKYHTVSFRFVTLIIIIIIIIMRNLITLLCEEPYDITITWIRTLLSFEILRSVHTCVRGSRTPFHKIPQGDFIDDCRLNATQACVIMAWAS